MGSLSCQCLVYIVQCGTYSTFPVCQLDPEEDKRQSLLLPIKKGQPSSVDKTPEIYSVKTESTFPKTVVQYSLITSEELTSSSER